MEMKGEKKCAKEMQSFSRGQKTRAVFYLFLS